MAATKSKLPGQPGDKPRPLNDKPRAPARNGFPKAAPVDLRKLGAVGVRVMTERALGACHNFGDEAWKLLGVQRAELARHRPAIIDALRSIVADVDRSNFLNRGAAVALLGEVGGAAALPDLQAVLESRYERRSTRGWAAVGVGRLGGEKGVEVLQRYVADADPLIRRKVIDGLVESKSKAAVALLERMAEKDADAFVAGRAHGALRRLEEHLKVEPRAPLPRPERRAGRKTAVPGY